MLKTNDMDLKSLAELSNKRLDTLFKQYLQDIPSLELKMAMEYSLLNGGKRLRPLMIYATGCAFNAALECMDIPALSVELIHTYSLIHDDLPCMDNADLRRGKPSSHKVYGEGMAVLTGDALHTLAMQIMAAHPAPLKPEKRVEMMGVLSKACGPFGMAAGQALDITIMNDTNLSIDLLKDVYRLKTGALFSACIELGYIVSGDDNDINRRSLKKFGDAVGLAFQIQDDILDIVAETAALGKQQGIDFSNAKITYPRLVGIDAASDKVKELYNQALEAINYLGSQASLLRDLAGQMLNRSH